MIFYFLCLLLTLFSHVCVVSSVRQNSARKELESFVVEGVDIEIEQFPWLVQLLILKMMFCGGVIISERVTLTAGHCLFLEDYKIKPNEIEIYSGSTYRLEGSRYEACRVYPHENYDKDPEYYYLFDIGLILLKTKFSFNSRSQKARIIPLGKDFKKEYFSMSVAGWGNIDNYGTKANKLQMTRMRYVSHQRCNNSNTDDGLPMPVPNHMFCLLSDRWSSDCHGDSGSGVMWGNYLVGIVATGRQSACGSDTMPSMYTDVSFFRDWIEEHAASLNETSVEECSSHNHNRHSKINRKKTKKRCRS